MPKQRRALPGEINDKPIDVFTLTHFGSGAVMGALGFSWRASLATALAWDLLIEPFLKDVRPGWFPVATQDTPRHIATDTAAWLLGWGTVVTLQGR